VSRPLVPGLLAEGKTDELFLGAVIFRQLRALTESGSRHVVDVGKTEIGGCRTVKDHDRIVEAAVELAGDCNLVFVHSDHDKRDKAASSVARLADLGKPVIALVPVRETEAWLLADRAAWATLRGSDLKALPRPRDIEKVADPKPVLDAVIPKSGSRGRDDFFEYIGQNIDLAALANVPAYAEWVAEAEDALKGLGYL
jgi:Domain of unknown function (DUF4276)